MTTRLRQRADYAQRAYIEALKVVDEALEVLAEARKAASAAGLRADEMEAAADEAEAREANPYASAKETHDEAESSYLDSIWEATSG